MGLDDPEQRHDLIADELIDDASEGFDDADRLGFDATHEEFHLLSVKPFMKGGVAGQVGEQNRGLSSIAFPQDP
jgi:hypothetical protein